MIIVIGKMMLDWCGVITLGHLIVEPEPAVVGIGVLLLN